MTKGRWLAAVFACILTGIGHAASAQVDSLTLQQPEDVTVWREFDPGERAFTVYITWEDVPDSLATYIHPPDTSGWAAGHQSVEMSMPASGGVYTGDIDRTIRFRALETGQVGVSPRIRITYEIVREEFLNGTIDVGASYTPGTPIPLVFRVEGQPGQQRRFGIEVSFSEGWVDAQGGFVIGAEDFEGYHIWRGIQPDGSDLTVIGELSKQEAFLGGTTGGSIADSIYYYSVIPTLRDSLTWFSDFGTIDCLGRQISLELTDRQFFWYDCGAFNGFTYYYAVTTFDRDYSVQSGRQGLQKFDNCQPTQGVAYECEDDLESITIEVDAQTDVKRIYAVPNPYRSGGSRLTQENYHNFPDNMVRFVNVPTQATIRIYTVAGDLVWEGEHDGFDGNIEWNLENGNGESVASGVYIFKVEAVDGQTVYGRLVVIR